MRSVPRSVLAAYAACLGLAALLALALRPAPHQTHEAAAVAPAFRRVHVTAVPPPLAALTASVFGADRAASPWVRAHDVFLDPSLANGFLVVDDGVHAPASIAVADLAPETSVTLEEARPLRLVLVDDEGRPLADATLRAFEEPWASALPEARADAAGTVVIARPPHGAFRVALASPNHVTRVLEASALSDDHVALEATVRRTFETVDAHGEPLTEARVWVAPSGAFEAVADALPSPGVLALLLPRRTPAPVRVETANACSTPGLVLRGEGAAPKQVRLREGWFQRVAVRTRDRAPLEARLRFGDPDDARWRAETRTGDDGIATIGPLCSAAVSVTADIGEATATVVLRRGEVAEASLVVERPARLRVTVVDEDGHTTPNVRVALAAAEERDASRGDEAPAALLGRGFVPMGELGVTRGPVATLAELERDGFAQGAVGHPLTDQEGVLRLAHLAPGRIAITLRRPGFVPTTLGPFELVAGEETAVQARIARAAHLEGTLTDDRGFPQRAHVVRLTDAAGKASEVVTGRDGRFVFDEARGDVVLAVLRGGGEELDHVALHLEPGAQTVHDLVVRSGEAREYRIRTLDVRGYPIEGASVALRPAGGLVRLGETRSARDGTASLAFPLGTNLEIVVRATGFAPAVLVVDGDHPEATVTLERSEERVVRVVDDRRGAPVQGALVLLRAAYGSGVVTFARTTDRSGAVRVETPARATVETIAVAAEYGVARGSVPSGAREHTVRLASAVSFEGRVTNGESAIEGATIASEGLGRVEPAIAAARSDREGRFRFAQASLATRTLEVCAPGYRCRRLSGLRGDDRRPVDLGTIALERAGAGAGADVAVDVRATSTGLVVDSVFAGSKAAESTLRSGDAIVLVDGKPAEASALRGPLGSTVVVTVDRGGTRERVALLRERVLRE